MDDLELLSRIRGGDESAFDSLFRRHYADLVGFCSAMLRAGEQAEDIVQDVMLELWRRRETIDIDESCRAYLFRSVRNRALNELRREGTVRKTEPIVREQMDVPEPPADTDVVASELEAHIQRAIASLGDNVRETFLLSRRDGMTYNEIAAVQEISVKTVEARMGRALKELRAKLASWL